MVESSLIQFDPTFPNSARLEFTEFTFGSRLPNDDRAGPIRATERCIPSDSVGGQRVSGSAVQISI